MITFKEYVSTQTLDERVISPGINPEHEHYTRKIGDAKHKKVALGHPERKRLTNTIT